MDLSKSLKDIAISQSGFVFDPTTGITFSVNATGQLILMRLRDGAALEAIEDELRAAFELAETDDPGRDVREFVRQLREQGIVRREGEGSPEPGGGDDDDGTGGEVH